MNITLFASLLVIALQGCAKVEAPTEPTMSVDPGNNVEYSTMKLISYNILKGMEFDRDSNFVRFVRWVNDQNPDVIALQETNFFTEETLGDLAARWGHNYVVRNVGATEYNVAFTSRYPITVVRKMEETETLTRGAVHIQVKGINFVTLHLWPYSTYPKDEGESGSGEEYRLREINCILDSTLVQDPTVKDWLFMGDFNCPSAYDKDYVDGTWTYKVHPKMLSSGLFDLVHENHSRFISSCRNTTNRIDFIYGTRSINSNVISADIIKDDFTTLTDESGNYPSDHYPVCVVFRYIDAK